MDSNATSIARQIARAPGETAPPGKNHKLPNIGDPFNPFGMFNGIWIPESLLKCSAISPSAKLLYGQLARFAGKDGRCFPSVRTLASELGMADRQVQRLIEELCTAGFLRKDAQYRLNGSQTVNTYVFLYHASLAPAPVIRPQNARPPLPENGHRPRGGKNVTGDKNVARRVTATVPLEDSPLNAIPVSFSSSSTAILTQAAADPQSARYPLSAARFREFFPRTTDSVIGRILHAVLAACPDATDDDIAAAIYTTKDQNSPGLWTHTMPTRVREVIRQRLAARTPGSKCQICKDAGMVWDTSDAAAWCPAGCDAAETERQRNPHFVAEWNAQVPNHDESSSAIHLDQSQRTEVAS